MKVSLIITLLFVLVSPLSLHKKKDVAIEYKNDISKVNKKAQNAWVESKFGEMTTDQRIGQLFMIRAHSDKGADHIAEVESLIKNYHVGGLCFFQGTPEKQAKLTNQYQALSTQVPLMISMDAEWGLGMRFKDDGISFPRQLTLGAITDNRLIYDMGKEVARQLKRLGVHVNFAPVVDINNNPNNPVINTRSFGEDRYNVTAKSYMYMKGMQDNGVMACAKHFPGHGDTDVDSHLDLPAIAHPRQRLDSIEMYPFKVLAQQKIGSMMVAHLFIPSLDNKINTPSTLSDKTITGILKNELNFEGLIFTDGLGMKGVTKHHTPGELEVKALQAGNDVLLLPENTPAAFKAIKAAMKDGSLDSLVVYESVKKVLAAKFALGLTQPQKIVEENIRADLNTNQALVLKQRLTANALTLVRQNGNILPLVSIDTMKIASLSIGTSNRTDFQRTINKYVATRSFSASKSINDTESKRLINQLKEYDVVLVGLHGLSNSPSKNYGVDVSSALFLAELQQHTKVLVTVFGNPYALRYFDRSQNILLAYDDDDISQSVAAQAIFGAIPIKGKLPITASQKTRYFDGISIGAIGRLQYDLPESVGMDSRILNEIDDIVNEGLSDKAMPGCNVLVAKDGKIVFHKAYGYHTYSKKTPASIQDIYDLASITKVAATTLSLMKLHETGKVNVYNTLGEYLPELEHTNKKNLAINDVLAHQARLKAWIPFYKETITKSTRNPKPLSRYYKKSKSEDYSVKVTNKLFMKSSYVPEVWKTIYESELRKENGYKYSDLGFIMMAKMVEEVTQNPLNMYAYETYYKPLGLNATLYNPTEIYGKNSIVPTEDDKYFRRQRIQGDVHDMGAAMLGGVSGHAGLFSTSNELAILMQMLLNQGYYGGKQYLNPSTVQTFTQRHAASSRRGLGFDMREIDPTKTLNMGSKASVSTFGHLGFTGTCAWVDPESGLIYIFLSNRTFPSMNNYKLNKLDIRPRIQNKIYEAMGK